MRKAWDAEFANLIMNCNSYDEKSKWVRSHCRKRMCQRENIVIPAGVTSIPPYFFEDFYSLEQVEIPPSVTIIGDRAFYKCKSLAFVTIPSSVTIIGDETFWGCKSLAIVTIPSSVTIIGDRAFWGCKSLASVTIPSSVTIIGDRAFWGCESLESVEIPSSVTSIGDETFWGCKSLMSVSIPSSVRIGKDAFKNCSRDIKIIRRLNQTATTDKTSSQSSKKGVFGGLFGKRRGGPRLLLNRKKALPDHANGPAKTFFL